MGEDPKRAIKKLGPGDFSTPAPSLAAGGEVLFNEAVGTTIRPPREFQSRLVAACLKQFFLLIFDDIPAMSLSECQGFSPDNAARCVGLAGDP